MKLGIEMDLVAVDDGLAFLVRWHERREAVDEFGGFGLDQDVAQLGRPHLLELGCWLPFGGRVFIVASTCLLDQVEARREILWGQVVSPHQSEVVLGVCAWMGPVGHPSGLVGASVELARGSLFSSFFPSFFALLSFSFSAPGPNPFLLFGDLPGLQVVGDKGLIILAICLLQRVSRGP